MPLYPSCTSCNVVIAFSSCNDMNILVSVPISLLRYKHKHSPFIHLLSSFSPPFYLTPFPCHLLGWSQWFLWFVDRHLSESSFLSSQSYICFVLIFLSSISLEYCQSPHSCGCSWLFQSSHFAWRGSPVMLWLLGFLYSFPFLSLTDIIYLPCWCECCMGSYYIFYYTSPASMNTDLFHLFTIWMSLFIPCTSLHPKCPMLFSKGDFHLGGCIQPFLWSSDCQE